MVDDHRYECEHCHTSFVREVNYLKHKCTQMVREEEINTPRGQAAYSLYGRWLKSHNRAIPTVNTFLTSKVYSTFIEFAAFIKKVKIPDTDLFIRLMKDRSIHPQLWLHDSVYALYMEYLDAQVSPVQHMKYTVDTLYKLADIFECEVKQLFHELTVSELSQLIRERRISPWILLHSREFKKLLIKINPDERSVFETLIRPGYWTFVLDKNSNKKHVELAKNIVEGLKI